MVMAAMESEGEPCCEHNVTDVENLKDIRHNSPPYLLVIVGEPFDEVQKRAIIHRIATGLCRLLALFLDVYS